MEFDDYVRLIDLVKINNSYVLTYLDLSNEVVTVSCDTTADVHNILSKNNEPVIARDCEIFLFNEINTIPSLNPAIIAKTLERRFNIKVSTAYEDIMTRHVTCLSDTNQLIKVVKFYEQVENLDSILKLSLLEQIKNYKIELSSDGGLFLYIDKSEIISRGLTIKNNLKVRDKSGIPVNWENINNSILVVAQPKNMLDNISTYQMITVQIVKNKLERLK